MILSIILTILFFILLLLYIKEKKTNKEIYKINKKVEEENNRIIEKQEQLNKTYNQKQQELEKMQQSVDSAEMIVREAFTNYNEILNNEYKDAEYEYDEHMRKLYEIYDNAQTRLMQSISKVEETLAAISATRAAAIQAQLKEQEIKDKEDFYSLTLDEVDKHEVRILQNIENELRDPRPLRMVIWTSYYSKKANDLASRVLGPNEVCGIYKITSKTTSLCYIGQAKKIRERWREHMKCGLGIDTPANNKLYQAMLKEGLSNFTFELLEICSESDLDKKEASFIEIYDSKNYGYNSTSGNKKS